MTTKVLEKIVKYESGLMEEKEFLMFFQCLINSGLVWQLQGHYGRVASNLIDEGVCYAS
jgi:hypothetical protein